MIPARIATHQVSACRWQAASERSPCGCEAIRVKQCARAEPRARVEQHARVEQPGTMRELRRTGTDHERLGLDLIAIPADAVVELDHARVEPRVRRPETAR
ncbi:hypothetical protein NCAST_26_00270 [Nocardia asteroides NBRC 15531]|uniref:Uncharacterized protein n=1 Tax=Nocardia asteroides NBRC 15531 TaxID=1110697 RepID=U5ECH0_NOCAS|nr:hypothetical protein NCAST_26_00270 [Nocardia asteroides NBRC 15531]